MTRSQFTECAKNDNRFGNDLAKLNHFFFEIALKAKNRGVTAELLLLTKRNLALKTEF